MITPKSINQDVLDSMIVARYAQLIKEGCSHTEAMRSIMELFDKSK